MTQTYVITGANSGIGKITARELARRGGRVVLAGRSRDKTLAVIDELRADTGNDHLSFVSLDLGSLDSVRACATELLAREPAIHVLINNAGLAGVRGLTKDGFEVHFGTNHLGPFLLTRLLLDRLIASATPGAPARIVNVASKSHFAAKRGIDWDAQHAKTRSLTGLDEYGVSKLANVLFSAELARRLDPAQVATYALHPGVVATDVWRQVPAPVRWLMKKFMITPERGAEASLRCATDPTLAGETGKYYDVGGVERRPSKLAADPALAEALWARSEAWTGLPAGLPRRA